MEIAKRYGEKVVSYKDFLSAIEEDLWTDVKVEPKMTLEQFYQFLENNGPEAIENN